jgi:hypothetical protein
LELGRKCKFVHLIFGQSEFRFGSLGISAAMRPKTKSLLGQLLGGIIVLFYFGLRELDFNVFSDASHFRKALVKLAIPNLFLCFGFCSFLFHSRHATRNDFQNSPLPCSQNR